jgi:hypothetical protein
MKCNFVSTQKRGDTLPLANCATSRGKDSVKTPVIEKAYPDMGETSKDTLPLAESGLNTVLDGEAKSA